jgi:hypothetical protein
LTTYEVDDFEIDVLGFECLFNIQQREEDSDEERLLVKQNIPNIIRRKIKKTEYMSIFYKTRSENVKAVSNF